MRIACLIYLFSVWANAADWYVRPPVITSWSGSGVPTPTAGIYGDQDGTTYADAWNGLRSVVWGSGGVQAGDTLWVCGKHIHKMTSGAAIAAQGIVSVGASGIEGDPIVVRGDYDGDVGEVWSWFHDQRSTVGFGGPDGSGVYYQTNQTGWGNLYTAMGEVVDGIPRMFGVSGANTWADGLGEQHPLPDDWVNPGTNYIKTFSGGAPSKETLLSSTFGYRFDLRTNSFITLRNLKLLGATVTGTRWTSGQEDTFHLSRNIAFEGCHLFWNYGLSIYPGWDNWSFISNRFETNSFHVYTILDSRTRGATNLYVGSSVMNVTAPNRLANIDGHAIGIQGGWGNVIEENDIRNCRGTAIEFWTYSQGMSNMIVRHNYIKDTGVNVTSGSGIVVSGDNAVSVTGLRVGYQIYGNIIDGTGLDGTEAWQGSGISSNSKDGMDVFNNVVIDSNRAFNINVVSTGKASGRFFNNTIVSPRSGTYWAITSPETTDIAINHNLYYPVINTSSGFSSGYSYGANNVFAAPDFITTPGSSPSHYRLAADSPGRGDGVALPYTILDFGGRSFANPPDIGAWQYYGGVSINAAILNVGSVNLYSPP